MRQKTCEPVADAPGHEPRAPERAVPETHVPSTAAPRVKVFDGRAIALDHPDPAVGEALLMAALGTADRDFCGGIVVQLGDAASYGGEVDEQALNFMLSAVKGIKPRDHVETMLAAQMATVHVATLDSALRLARADTVVQQDFAERAINKLARTFAAQTEALKRYRSGGEPNVTVQHVSVGEGGQAIVGNVTQSPRGAAAGATPDRAASAGARPAGATSSRATPAGAGPAGARPAGATPSRAARPRATAPERPPISPPAPAAAPTTPPHRANIAPASTRRAR